MAALAFIPPSSAAQCNSPVKKRSIPPDRTHIQDKTKWIARQIDMTNCGRACSVYCVLLKLLPSQILDKKQS